MENNNQELTLNRRFAISPEKLWQYWTDPKLVSKWWGPQGFTIPVSEIDIKVGGRINIVMEDSAGLIKKGSRYPMTGEFTEITKPKNIVFTSQAVMNDRPILENLVTVTFNEINDQTDLMLHVEVTHAEPEAEMPLKGMEAGWTQSLDKLSELISGRD
jgi:uncharacterized protein YndB with AHSA1/START domain